MRIRRGLSIIGLSAGMLLVPMSGLRHWGMEAVDAGQQASITTEDVGDVVTINPSGEKSETTAPDFVFDFDDTEKITGAETSRQTTTGKAELTSLKTKKNVPKIKIKKVIKKRSAKKMRIYLRNTIKGADGYIVFVYVKKTSVKNHKKLFFKKVVKKNRKNILITKNKLKRKNELFVKICAFKKNGNKAVIISKYSKITKVRVK